MLSLLIQLIYLCTSQLHMDHNYIYEYWHQTPQLLLLHSYDQVRWTKSKFTFQSTTTIGFSPICVNICIYKAIASHNNPIDKIRTANRRANRIDQHGRSSGSTSEERKEGKEKVKPLISILKIIPLFNLSINHFRRQNNSKLGVLNAPNLISYDFFSSTGVHFSMKLLSESLSSKR